MADKKRSIRPAILLIILVELIGIAIAFFVCGCASQTPREDSTHYVAQTQPQGYPCPNCGYRVDMNNVNKNIRMENICSSCGRGFFYTPRMENVANSNNGYEKHEQRPKIYGPSSSYYSDTRYQRFGVGGYSFKETKLGFSETSWYFHDSRVKSHRIVPHWRTTRYHYP